VDVVEGSDGVPGRDSTFDEPEGSAAVSGGVVAEVTAEEVRAHRDPGLEGKALGIELDGGGMVTEEGRGLGAAAHGEIGLGGSKVQSGCGPLGSDGHPEFAIGYPPSISPTCAEGEGTKWRGGVLTHRRRT
jgi:hypothetical protein